MQFVLYKLRFTLVRRDNAQNTLIKLYNLRKLHFNND
ncbi:hypothetical protein Sbal117_2094 [Shewanella baltica OS117]|nr:hypothetical protein Sbal117_2094 [Shewanella baltica OS117]